MVMTRTNTTSSSFLVELTALPAFASGCNRFRPGFA
jgi:hypothetical protein